MTENERFGLGLLTVVVNGTWALHMARAGDSTGAMVVLGMMVLFGSFHLSYPGNQGRAGR